MEKRKLYFSVRQPEVVVCASGRAMACLNEKKVTANEPVPVSMDDEGNMKYENKEKILYEYDVYWIDDVEVNAEVDVLKSAIAEVISEITDYDSSPAVNSFLLNGESVWLDKATRVGLMNSTTIAKTAGFEKTTLWVGDMKIDMDCDKAIQLLSSLEMYALACFDVTARHKKAVSELDDIADVIEYDYKEGYPDKLDISV